MSVYTDTDFLKTNYLAGCNNQLSSAPGTLYGYLDKNPVDLEGATTIVKIRLGESLGQTSITEGGNFASPGDIEYDEATLELSRLNHAIQLTGHEYDLLRSGQAGAEDAMGSKMDSAAEVMEGHIATQTWMDGTGILANVASSSGSTITLDATTTAQVDRDRYVRIDDPNRARYDVVHGTTGAQQVTGFTVTGIVESTNVLTCSATMTSATSAGVVVRSGDWATGGAFRSLEFKGVQAAISATGNYLGIDRSAVPQWQSVVISNSGTLRTTTVALLHELLNKTGRRSAKRRKPTADTHAAFASPGVWSAVHELVAPNLRYSIGERPDVGWREVDMFGIPLYEDYQAPRNSIYLCEKSSLEFAQAKHRDHGLLKFVERGGDIWFQKNATSGGGHADAVLAYLVGFIGMFTRRPRNHGALLDLTEVAGIY